MIGLMNFAEKTVMVLTRAQALTTKVSNFDDDVKMSVAIGQGALDQYFDSILNLAPAEGNCPIQLSERTNEAKCFQN